MTKESEVYWVGSGPGKKKAALADDENFVAAIRAACETAGCRFQRFISALGPYGTWVAEIERNGEDQRVVWNGKEARLVLQVKLPEGGWEDPKSLEVPEQNTDGFVARVKTLLADAPDGKN